MAFFLYLPNSPPMKKSDKKTRSQESTRPNSKGEKSRPGQDDSTPGVSRICMDSITLTLASTKDVEKEL